MAIRTYRGIELGLGQADPVADVSAKLEAAHPGHLILVQAGTFLHGYDRTAYALATLKGYKLKLVGTAEAPHLRIGFPVGNFKRRLWNMVADFGIPYVVALGAKASERTVYVSQQPTGNATVLDAVSPAVLSEVIADLRQRNEVNKAAARELLTHPDTADFQLKAKSRELDTLLIQDLAKMPRDMRATFGENLRTTETAGIGGVPPRLTFCVYLTTARRSAHHSPVTEKDVTGFGSPSGAAMSRDAVAMRLFYRPCAPLWAGRTGSRKARRCSTGLPTRSVPPTPFGSGRRFVQRTGAHTMTNEVTIDRATASKINPLISTISSEDTLSSMASVIYELGYLVVGERDLATGSLFHLFGAIAGALGWEVENISSPKCLRGECEGSLHG